MENFKIGCKYIRAQMVRVFYFLTLLILSVPANAQNKGLSFEHLSSKDGLPFSTINDIYQDKKGFIWIATFNGLFRYDGYNFKTFTTKPDDVHSLTDNWIACLFVDSQGVLYAGTSEQGLNIYNSQKEQFIRHHAAPGANALGSDRIRSIKEDLKGIIWIGTADKGFYSFDKKSNTFASYSLPATCANNCIDLVVDKHNSIWMVTSLLEVVKFQPATNEFTMIQSFPGKQIDEVQTKLFIDAEDNLWVGSNPGGLYCYNTKTNTKQHWTQDSFTGNRLISNNITDILRANDGKIWVATDGGGIDVLTIETGEIYHNQSNENNPASLSTNAVYCLYSDNTNTIWAGTYLGGINIFNPKKKKFSGYRPGSDNAVGSASNSVLSIFEDKDRDLLIGTDGSGLYLYNREQQGEEFIDLKVDLNGKSNTCPRVVKTILQTSDHTIWLVTYDSGLVRFDKKTRTYHHLGWDARNRERISGPTVWSMMEDDNNILWIGVWHNGIDIYNWKTNKVVKKFNQANGFKGTLVSQIFKDKKNRIWVATLDAGINRYLPETDSFDNYQHNPKKSTGLSSNIVSCMFEDSKGGIWAGTIGGGLNRYHETTDNFRAPADNINFMSSEITGILEDHEENLWISTYKGISKYSPATNQLKNYDASDGLQGYIFNDGATFKASDGEFYFGGTKGFNAFYPEQIQDSPDQTPLYITSFSIFNKLVSVNCPDSILKASIIETKEIILPYDKTDLMFEFIAINYQSAKKNEYAYVLENFDKDWNFVGTKRFATYTNLNPGEYLLKVKATNNDGIWNEVPTTIHITITPPFWQRWWFITLSVLAAVGALILIFKWRNRHLLRQKNELAQKV
jgi:ligand-binding sensor domain-containing protein